jgi:hypothetical protein
LPTQQDGITEAPPAADHIVPAFAEPQRLPANDPSAVQPSAGSGFWRSLDILYALSRYIIPGCLLMVLAVVVSFRLGDAALGCVGVSVGLFLIVLGVILWPGPQR